MTIKPTHPGTPTAVDVLLRLGEVEVRPVVRVLRLSGRLEVVAGMVDAGPEFPLTCGIVYCPCGEPHMGVA